MDRYIRFARPDGSTGAGLLEGDRIAVIAEPFWEGAKRTGEELDLAAVRLLPPCEPRSIVCVGLNYASHLGGQPAPDPPTLFLKPLSSIAVYTSAAAHQGTRGDLGGGRIDKKRRGGGG
ncbi:MAG: DUF2437 domain-containing protein, partial [Dehalococcoidia bacterium]|nr:DUF2437 domain-containing protein [Dehalococcoidia bacterium]